MIRIGKVSEVACGTPRASPARSSDVPACLPIERKHGALRRIQCPFAS